MPSSSPDISSLLRQVLGPAVSARLEAARAAAERVGISLFVIGGCVRDILLSRATRDLDLVTEGEAPELATRLAERIGATVKTHERFRTATLTLPDGDRIDIASARKESYEEPAALPHVEPAPLRDDLARRDFTINSMAISITGETFGRLIDPFDGRGDLERRLIRILHGLSFADDPTRAFRAVRFEQRLRFELEPTTEALLRQAVEQGLAERLTGPRVRQELFLLLDEPDPVAVVARLEELGVWGAVHADLIVAEQAQRLLQAVRTAVRDERPVSVAEEQARAALLAALLSALDEGAAREVAAGWQLTAPVLRACLAAHRVCREPPAPLQEERPRRSEIASALRDLPPAALVCLWAQAEVQEHPARQEWLTLYVTELARATSDINGADLVDAGYQPGSAFAPALEAALAARLDGEAPDRETQLAVALRALGAADAPRKEDG